MDQLLLILVDESLSMKPKKAEVVKAINQFLEVQREINPQSRLIFIKFNNQVTVMHQGTDLQSTEPLRMSDYNPAGRTALYDAVATAIKLADTIRTVTERVTCIMITDGEDTASKENVSTRSIAKMVAKYETRLDWSFTYIGKSSEYWERKKPVSKISYDSKPPSYVRPEMSNVLLRRSRSAAAAAAVQPLQLVSS